MLHSVVDCIEVKYHLLLSCLVILPLTTDVESTWIHHNIIGQMALDKYLQVIVHINKSLGTK